MSLHFFSISYFTECLMSYPSRVSILHFCKIPTFSCLYFFTALSMKKAMFALRNPVMRNLDLGGFYMKTLRNYTLYWLQEAVWYLMVLNSSLLLPISMATSKQRLRITPNYMIRLKSLITIYVAPFFPCFNFCDSSFMVLKGERSFFIQCKS